MRILVTGQPIYSHLFPVLVPLVQAACARGHTAAIATADSVAADLARSSVAHLALPRIPSMQRLRTDPALAARFGLPQQLLEPGRRRAAPAAAQQVARAYAGPIAGLFAEDLLELAPRWRPDVIVHEPAALGGYLAAERLGIPNVVADISPYALRELHLVHEVINAQRTALGLAPTTDPMHPHRHLRAGLVPEAWYPPELRLPSGRYYHLPGGERQPLGPLADLLTPGARAPLVLASLGSLALSLPGMGGLLGLIADALGRLHCRAVLSLGGLDRAAAHLGQVPEHVRVVSFAPQQRLLPRCDLLVTHAGFGSVREALMAGVPMVALPTVSDGPANGARIAELGLGMCLDADTCSAETLAGACERVLSDPAFRDRVGAMRRDMLASPGVDTLLEDLLALRAASPS